ncbi:hypothetical protein JCM30760_07700 [Thiomicrorhabdus hydrogeniphila]
MSLLSFESLSDWVGYKRPSDVVKFLDSIGVGYFLDRHKRPITTTEALNINLVKNKIQNENEWEKGFD